MGLGTLCGKRNMTADKADLRNCYLVCNSDGHALYNVQEIAFQKTCQLLQSRKWPPCTRSLCHRKWHHVSFRVSDKRSVLTIFSARILLRICCAGRDLEHPCLGDERRQSTDTIVWNDFLAVGKPQPNILC